RGAGRPLALAGRRLARRIPRHAMLSARLWERPVRPPRLCGHSGALWRAATGVCPARSVSANGAGAAEASSAGRAAERAPPTAPAEPEFRPIQEFPERGARNFLPGVQAINNLLAINPRRAVKLS